MDLGGTGAQLWPLVTGNNNNPSLSQGQSTSFFFNTVPDRCPTGPLAYYLPLVFLTIYGNVVQAGGSGSAIPYDELVAALVDSIDWINCWHGTVVSANYVKGTNLPVVEYYANGFRFATRRPQPIPAANGTYPFQYTIAITPSVSRLGRLMNDTMQLAKLFQQSQLKINVASSSVMTQLSPGGSLTSLSAKASAVLVPRSDLILGTPIETIVHEMVASQNSNQVQIKGFGTDTLLKGINNKGGVVFCGELTSVNLQGGAFAMENASQFSFPWRGQDIIDHAEAVVAMSQLGNMPNDRPQTLPIGGTADAEFNNPPYIAGNTDTWASGSNKHFDLTGNMFFPFVQGGNDLALTDVQTAASDASYFLTISGGFTGATHRVLAMYARQWLDTMRADWLKQVTAGGTDSLASYVLGGTNAVNAAKLLQRRPRSKHLVTADQLTYLPWQLVT